MKTLILSFIILFVSNTAFAQEKLTRKQLKKQSHSYAFKSSDLPGVNYQKRLRPKTIRWITLTICLGILGQQVATENIKHAPKWR